MTRYIYIDALGYMVLLETRITMGKDIRRRDPGNCPETVLPYITCDIYYMSRKTKARKARGYHITRENVAIKRCRGKLQRVAYLYMVYVYMSLPSGSRYRCYSLYIYFL